VVQQVPPDHPGRKDLRQHLADPGPAQSPDGHGRPGRTAS